MSALNNRVIDRYIFPVEDFQLNRKELVRIFGHEPQQNVYSYVKSPTIMNDKEVSLTCLSVELIALQNAKKQNRATQTAYKIFPFGFFRKSGDEEVEADGLFEGPLDSTGLKVMNLFFSKSKEGSLIYINNHLHCLRKNKKDENFYLIRLNGRID
jgi:hypothetical protein